MPCGLRHFHSRGQALTAYSCAPVDLRKLVLKRLPFILCAAALAACSGGRESAPPPADPTPLLREGPARWTPPRLVSLPEAQPPRINEAGVRIIMEHEGLRLHAYHLAGQWLIGYGHAATAAPEMTITKAEAQALLFDDLKMTEAALDSVLTVPLNDNEYSAVVALAYNLGVSRFTGTLVYKRLEAGDKAGAADAFRYLDSARINGEMRELASLKSRRADEHMLFLTPVDGEAQAFAEAAE